MVKPDVKVNYYGALELPTDATIEDVKKQYRKLALKYHPDRNPGKEQEFSPKFQAIQAAHEILGDPTSKVKYDADRRRAGLYPSSYPKPSVPTRNPTGNPYQAHSAWPPPPRRTATTSAKAFHQSSDIPRKPTASERFTNFPPPPTSKKGATQERANMFTAWQNMNPQQRAQAQATASAQSQTTPQRPPPPPRQETRYPSEEDIRAGYKYQVPPAYTDEHRSAWSQFNNTNAGQPGMSRTKSTRTPRKAGFDPGSTQDEPSANLNSNYSHKHRASVDSNNPTPAFPPPPPPPSRETPLRPNIYGQFRPSTADGDTPFAEGSRVRTPYSSYSGEQTYFSSEQLRRSQSTRDASGMQKKAEANSSQARHRSASPPKPAAQQKGSKGQPFVVYSSSETSSGDSDSSATSLEPDRNKTSQKSQDDGPNPFLRNFDRPKKVPTPPSTRLNGTPTGSKPPFPFGSAADATGSNKESPASGEKGDSTMYDPPSDSLPKTHTSPPLLPTLFSRNIWKGPWAIPSSVNPFKSEQRLRKDSASQQAGSGVGRYVDSSRATQQAPLGSIPFPLASLETPRKPTTAFGTRSFTWSIPSEGPRTASVPVADEPFVFGTLDQNNADSESSFNIPIGSDTFQSNKDAKSRSEENINTAFSPDEWSGTFTGAADNIFAAPPPSRGRKGSSPLRHGRESGSARPGQFGTDSTAKSPLPATEPPAEQQSAAAFKPDIWQKSSWSFQPDPMRPASSGGSMHRPSSRTLHKTYSTPKPATVEPVAESADQFVESSAPETAAADDAMDIDPATPPVVQDPSTKDGKGPRMVSVPPSQWRQSQGPGAQQSADRRASATVDSKPSVSLDDLAQTLDSSANGGLHGLGDIRSTLPFTSKASTEHPTRSFEPQIPSLPEVPAAPTVPNKLTKTSWKLYCVAMSGYLGAFHTFNKTMHVHFRERLKQEDKLVQACPRALEAVGQSGDVGFPSYTQAVKEDEYVRECWNIGHEQHAEAVKTFEKIKERVKQLSEGPGLVDG